MSAPSWVSQIINSTHNCTKSIWSALIQNQTHDSGPASDTLGQLKLRADQYAYSPLAYPDSTRVLILLPASDFDCDVICNLIDVRLSHVARDKIRYKALSYVWGLEIGTHTVQIQGKTLPVGTNLDSALRHFRRRDRPIHLWIDALCIDQMSVGERNHQVQQMRNIYSSAFDTVIYLGDNLTNTSKSAWNFLERHSTWALNSDGEIDSSQPDKVSAKQEFRGDLSDVENDVLERPWFRRVWVFQEAVVSRELSVQCGSRRIAWDDFCKAILTETRYHDRYGSSLRQAGKVEIVRNMFQARIEYQAVHQSDYQLPVWFFGKGNRKKTDRYILDTLQQARRLEASDPRDKIFALLGVSTGIDPDDSRFYVDYGRSYGDIYTRFARNFMAATEDYEILSYVDYGLQDIRRTKNNEHRYIYLGEEAFLLDSNGSFLPSWVPNWDRSEWTSRSFSTTILSTLEKETEDQQRRRTRIIRQNRSWLDSGHKLAAVGLVVGRIAAMGPIIAVTGQDEAQFQQIRNQHQIDNFEARQQIMRYWHDLFATELPNRRVFDSTTVQPSFPHLFRLMSNETNFSKNSVEHHLHARARVTAIGSENNSLEAEIVADESSIVDGRCVASYETVPINASLGIRREGLVIVPPRSKEGDLIIRLHGARVPFIVRESKKGDRTWGWMLSSISGLHPLPVPRTDLQCQLLGECLVNEYETFRSDEKYRFVIY